MRFLLCAIAVVLTIAGVTACPPGCTCDANRATAVCTGLTKIPTDGLPNNLQWFQCGQCNLGSLTYDDVKAITNVRTLRLADSGITDFTPDTFSDFINLHNAYLNNNQIKILRDGALAGMGNVAQLHLENNQIETIESGAFYGLGSLLELSIARNKLTNIDPALFKDTPKLGRLFAQYNQIKLAPYMFQNLPNIVMLNIIDNDFTSIPKGAFSGMTKLRSLAIQGNDRLTSIEDGAFDGLPNLRSLNLGFNAISKIDSNAMKPLTNVVSLTLSDNKLTEIDPAMLNRMPKLQEVYLSDNLITKAPTGLNLPLMQWYSFGDNQVTEIPADMGFVNAPFLRTAHWDGNYITKVDALHFSKFSNLNVLWLHKNKIATLDETVLKSVFTKLRHLSLYGNPLNCDCKMAWVKDLKVYWEKSRKLRCATPHNKLLLTETTDADFLCTA